MEPALWAAKTGLDAQQTQMTVTANNLANVSTTGFKASRGVFEDLLYQNVTQVGANTSQTTQSPSGLQPQGGNLLTESASSGTATTGTPGVSGLGTLVQGSLESSNVNVVDEMVIMIQIQRAYEMN